MTIFQKGINFLSRFKYLAGKNISDRMVLLFFGAIIALEFVIIYPLGNYPLIDDWQSALTVFEFVKSGRIFYPEYLSAFSLPQILLGIIISGVFGFSFVVLRVSTVFFAWGSLCLMYLFLRENDFSQKISIAATSLLLAFPLFIFLSFTFMSDVPALFFLLGALFFFSRGFRKQHYPSFVWGALFSGLGFFTRQFDILIAVAAMLVYFFCTSLGRKNGYGIFGLLFVAIGVVLAAASRIGITSHHAILSYIPQGTFFQEALVSFSFFILLVIFFAGTILPAMTTCTLGARGIPRVTIPRLLLFLGIVGIGGYALFFLLAPFLTIITYHGFGSVRIVMAGQTSTWGPLSIYGIIWGLCLLCAIWVCYHRTLVCAVFKKQSWNRFFLLYAILYSVGISIFFPLFDRYYLLLVPLACYVGAIMLKKYPGSLAPFYACIFVMATYSLIGTYNYFGWNDARWELGGRVVESGIPREQINGGYEWNGWYFYKLGLDTYLRQGIPQISNINDFLFYHDVPYILSYSLLPDTVVVDSIKVRGVFSNIKKMYALKKMVKSKHPSFLNSIE